MPLKWQHFGVQSMLLHMMRRGSLGSGPFSGTLSRSPCPVCRSACAWPVHDCIAAPTTMEWPAYLPLPLDGDTMHVRTVLTHPPLPSVLHQQMLDRHLLNTPHPGLFWAVHFREKSRQPFALLVHCETAGICLPMFKHVDYVKILCDFCMLSFISMEISILFSLIHC